MPSLEIGFNRRTAAVWTLAFAALLAWTTGQVRLGGGDPLSLLIVVPVLGAVVVCGLRCALRRRPVLVVDSDGVAGSHGRLPWAGVERVVIAPRGGLVVHGAAGARVRMPLVMLDTPVDAIVARIEREWGRPVGSVRRDVVAGSGLALQDGDHALAADGADRDQASA